jgi:hypothetical protein
MKYDIDVEWTGSYPNLCRGSWIISINGIKLAGLGNGPMNTYGEYDIWSFAEDWGEEWGTYTDGESWGNCLPNNLEMSLKLAGFDPNDSELIEQLYKAVQQHDWRHNSCGGCI